MGLAVAGVSATFLLVAAGIAALTLRPADDGAGGIASDAADPLPTTATGAASRTPTASATPVLASTGRTAGCPISEKGACAFAAEIEARVRADGFARIGDFVGPSEVTCSERSSVSPAVCAGKSGTKQTAYPLVNWDGRGGQPQTGSREESVNSLAAWRPTSLPAGVRGEDDLGPAAFRLVSISAASSAPPFNLMAAYSDVITEVVDGRTVLSRAVYLVVLEGAGDRWVVRSISVSRRPNGDLMGALRGTFGSFRTWTTNGTARTADADAFVFGADRLIAGGGACLNVRQRPDTAATVVKCLPDRGYVVIEGGPTEANGFRWWQVRESAALGGRAAAWGWAVQDYLAPGR